MKTQVIYLEDYDWCIEVFYDVRIDDLPEIMEALIALDCPEESLERSYRNIASRRANGGLTYTNVRERASIMVIGYADTLAQFLNTFSHELTHVAIHACVFLGVDLKSEELAYFVGDLAEQMHPLLEQYMCSCKKCKH